MSIKRIGVKIIGLFLLCNKLYCQSSVIDSYFKGLKCDTVIINGHVQMVMAKSKEDSLILKFSYFQNGLVSKLDFIQTRGTYKLFFKSHYIDFFNNGVIKTDSLLNEQFSDNQIELTKRYSENKTLILSREAKGTRVKIKNRSGNNWIIKEQEYNDESELVRKTQTEIFYR